MITKVKIMILHQVFLKTFNKKSKLISVIVRFLSAFFF